MPRQSRQPCRWSRLRRRCGIERNIQAREKQDETTGNRRPYAPVRAQTVESCGMDGPSSSFTANTAGAPLPRNFAVSLAHAAVTRPRRGMLDKRANIIRSRRNQTASIRRSDHPPDDQRLASPSIPTSARRGTLDHRKAAGGEGNDARFRCGGPVARSFSGYRDAAQRAGKLQRSAADRTYRCLCNSQRHDRIRRRKFPTRSIHFHCLRMPR
jgi:hypothetical protein